MGNIQDRNNLHPVFVMYHTEGFVQAEFAYAVLPVKLCQRVLHLFCRVIPAEFLRKLTDSFADSGIVDLALLTACLIIGQHGIFRYMKGIHHRCKIKVIQFLKDYDVMQHRLIDGAFYLSPDLTGFAVAVLIVHK